ncbi:LRIQ1 protein, partial [Phaetusa simplex]|nr:LRIQ1 protein [Phaetusa simplex]
NAKRKTDCTKTENHQFIVSWRQKHEAATLIQAFWKGFLLRKKLASALAAVKSDEVEDDYEEINVDDFTFSEKYSRPSNSSEHSNCLPLSPQEVWQCVNRPHSYSAENIHFHSRSRKGAMSQLSDWKEKNKFSFMSEKEEKISAEWYVKLFSLHSDFQVQVGCCCLLFLNPAVRLALFKNNENKHLHLKPPRKTQPINAGYFEGKLCKQRRHGFRPCFHGQWKCFD